MERRGVLLSRSSDRTALARPPSWRSSRASARGSRGGRGARHRPGRPDRPAQSCTNEIGLGVITGHRGGTLPDRPRASRPQRGLFCSCPRDVGETIGLAGLAGLERKKVRNLSGGQKQRLDLALGLIGNPELLLLDEPTTGSDPNARHEAWDVVRGLRSSGTRHRAHHALHGQGPGPPADRLAVISAGQIVAEGTPSEPSAAKTTPGYASTGFALQEDDRLLTCRSAARRAMG